MSLMYCGYGNNYNMFLSMPINTIAIYDVIHMYTFVCVRIFGNITTSLPPHGLMVRIRGLSPNELISRV